MFSTRSPWEAASANFLPSPQGSGRGRTLCGAFRAPCRREHPPEDAVVELVMMIKGGERVAEGDDHDRPADLVVEGRQEVPRRPCELPVRTGNSKQAEESDVMALCPSPSEPQSRLHDEENIEKVVNGLRRDLHPFGDDRGPLVSRDQPPDDPRNDNRGQKHAERDMN